MSMYVVNKEKGRNQLVFLENVETDQSVCLGKLSSEIMELMGYDFVAYPDEYNEEANTDWHREIDEHTAKELSKLTMPSHRPNRTKIKPQPVKTKPNGLDVLFGRADY